MAAKKAGREGHLTLCSKKNFAQAFPILGTISLIIWIVAWTSIGGALSRMLDDLNQGGHKWEVAS
jgi:hypothetical protein